MMADKHTHTHTHTHTHIHTHTHTHTHTQSWKVFCHRHHQKELDMNEFVCHSHVQHETVCHRHFPKELEISELVCPCNFQLMILTSVAEQLRMFESLAKLSNGFKHCMLFCHWSHLPLAIKLPLLSGPALTEKRLLSAQSVTWPACHDTIGLLWYKLFWISLIQAFHYIASLLILMVPGQNGVSQAWYIVEIYHSCRKPSICNDVSIANFSNQTISNTTASWTEHLPYTSIKHSKHLPYTSIKHSKHLPYTSIKHSKHLSYTSIKHSKVVCINT